MNVVQEETVAAHNLFKQRMICEEFSVSLFSLVTIDWTIRTSFKLFQGKFTLDIYKKKNFSKKVVKHWNRLSREMVVTIPGSI